MSRLLNLLPFSVPLRVARLVVTVLVLTALLAAVFIMPSCMRKRRNQLKSAALLNQVSYMEQLHLVTYFYEELLTIGATSRFEEQVRSLEGELEERQKAFLEADFQKALAEEFLRKLEAEMASKIKTDSLDLAEKKVAIAVELFQKTDQTFSRILEMLERDPASLSPVIQTRFMVYQEAERRFDAAPAGKRGDFRRTMDLARDELRSEWEKEREQRKNTRNLYQSEYQALLRKNRDAEQAFQRDLRKARRDLEEAIARVDRATRDREATRLQLENANKEWETRRASGLDESEPRLITVANAKITGYLDLRKLRTEWDEDTLVFYLPPAETDSVITDLDSTRLYQLMRGFKADKNYGGMYFDLFRQMQLALREVSVDVKAKAIERGILDETLEMGENYLREMAVSLGKPVRFVRPGDAEAVMDAVLPMLEDSILPPQGTRRLPDSLLK